MHVYDLIIVGSGPAGLATAIAASKRKLSYLVLEKGALVNTILHFPKHMVFFTTPELLEIGGLPFVTPYEKPTRYEALRYYRRAADTYNLNVAFGETVLSAQRGTGPASADPASDDPTGAPLVVKTLWRPDGAPESAGEPREYRTRTLVLATGAYDLPNLCGMPGEDLPHVLHYYTEPHPFYRKRVVIIGGQNSAAEAALDLYRSGSHVTIVHRKPEFGTSLKYWVKPDIENRVKEGTVAAKLGARVVRITPTSVLIEPVPDAGPVPYGTKPTGPEELPADAVFLLTGYHSDVTLLHACGVTTSEKTLEPTFDQETFETNVPGIYVAGQVITGQQSGKIFIENGRFHGERVADVIATRLAASNAGALV
jgi:thioredoxin reductase (NADPH)